jgi:hypothetical protein
MDIGADLGIQLAICFCFSCSLAVFGSSQEYLVATPLLFALRTWSE